jgi:hypothetical protein
VTQVVTFVKARLAVWKFQKKIYLPFLGFIYHFCFPFPASYFDSFIMITEICFAGVVGIAIYYWVWEISDDCHINMI